jgi:hypothetical protein
VLLLELLELLELLLLDELLLSSLIASVTFKSGDSSFTPGIHGVLLNRLIRGETILDALRELFLAEITVGLRNQSLTMDCSFTMTDERRYQTGGLTFTDTRFIGKLILTSSPSSSIFFFPNITDFIS